MSFPTMEDLLHHMDTLMCYVERANKDISSYGRTTTCFVKDDEYLIGIFIALYSERGYDVEQDHQFGVSRVHIE